MNAPSAEAHAITQRSKSNLALAFASLPRERRDDITVFYAWCRVIDDIADDPGETVDARRGALERWRLALDEPATGEPPLAPPVRHLIAKYRIDPALFREIIAGVEMDLQPVRYATWGDLRLYCYRVASAVGLVSIAIFGCREEAAREYAVNLGLALQVTNILRDVGEDWRNGGRVYLPAEDLARFGYSLEDLAAARRSEAFLALMRFEAERARAFYRAAVVPAGDRRALVAAEIMRAVYSRLLERMERDGFRIFDRRYRLGRLTKLALVLGGIVRAKFL